MTDTSAPLSASASPRTLPAGFRQAVVTAITVMSGFSLAFFRYWSVEGESGPWTYEGAATAAILAVGIVLQIVALFRALSVEDDDPTHYAHTVQTFLAGVATIGLGLLFSVVVAAEWEVAQADTVVNESVNVGGRGLMQLTCEQAAPQANEAVPR